MALSPEDIKRMDEITGLKTNLGANSQYQSNVDARVAELEALAGANPLRSGKKQSFTEALVKPEMSRELVNAQGGGVGTGVVKGAIDSLQKLAKPITSRLPEMKSVTTGQPIQKGFSEEELTANTPEEKFGKGVEKTVEFALPGAAGLKAPKTANFLVKALVEGLGSGAVATNQSGNLEQGVNTGLVAGGISGVMGGTNQILKNFGIPEKLYSTIFKNNVGDAVEELKTTVQSGLKQSDPELYNSLVKEKIIKEGVDGTIKINESLAKQALDRGLKGNIDAMAETVVKGQLKNELAAREIARNTKEKIAIPEKQFAEVLKEVAEKYKNVGFGEFASKADQLASKLKTGSIDAETALEARRLFDGLRIASSFDNNATLSTNQANFKFMADQLRNRLKKVPGFDKVMEEYSFNIEALESIAKEAVRRGNSNVITLVEGTLLGSGSPIGAGIYAGKKLLNTPTGITNIASMINTPTVKSTAGSTARGAAADQLVEGFTGGE